VGASVVDLALQTPVLVPQVQHLPDPFEVETGGHQRRDLVQPVDVVAAVPTRPAPAAGRLHESLPLVDPDGLGMQAGELGGYRDREQTSTAVIRIGSYHEAVLRSLRSRIAEIFVILVRFTNVEYIDSQ
jgi:hypothetical protein